ncbi:MAG: MFS transporter [Acidobacteriota bacterium]|nr:MFS transporter [Acidobacteriota bacterium]
MKALRKFTLLTSLYLSQGLPYGFFRQALPVLLRQQGVSLAHVGLSNLLALPWALKFLWAPLVDRVGWRRLGLRRSWILPLQGLAILTLLAMGFLDAATQLELVLAGILLINLFAATQDIATDGLAVGLLSHAERGLGNSIQVAAYRVGMVVGGGFLLILIDWLGWTSLFWVMAALLTAASVPIVLYREPSCDSGRASQATPQDRLCDSGRASQDEEEEAPQRPGFWDFLEILRRPGMAWWLLLLLLFKGGDNLTTGMLNPFLVDLGLSAGDIGSLVGLAGFAAGLVGALAGGWWVVRLGRVRGLVTAGLLQALGAAGYAVPALFAASVPALASLPALYGFCILEHFTGSLVTVTLFTMMMDVSRVRTAGSDYTLQASVVVVAQLGGRSLSGFSAEALGYAGNFLASGLISVLGALAGYLILRNTSFRQRLLAPTGASWEG